MFCTEIVNWIYMRNNWFIFYVDLLPNQMNILIDLLNNIPKSIIQDEIIPVWRRNGFFHWRNWFICIFQLLPILVRALTSSNESIWSASLQSISDLIKSEPNSIVDHIDTLLPRLTTLATYQKDMVRWKISVKSPNNRSILFLEHPYYKFEMFELSYSVTDT